MRRWLMLATIVGLAIGLGGFVRAAGPETATESPGPARQDPQELDIPRRAATRR